MAGRAKIPLHAREHYDDLDLAIKELGTLWILDRVNSGLVYNKKRREEMRAKRAEEPNTECPRCSRAGLGPLCAAHRKSGTQW